MSKSPGHQKHPDHKVIDTPLDHPMKVEINGELIADGRDVVKVDEDGYPPRYYFARSSVKMDKLSRTDTTSKCPFKGTAHYFDVQAGGKTLKDAVWTYEDPYEEHLDLKDRVAFNDEKVPGITIRAA